MNSRLLSIIARTGNEPEDIIIIQRASLRAGNTSGARYAREGSFDRFDDEFDGPTNGKRTRWRNLRSFAVYRKFRVRRTGLLNHYRRRDRFRMA